MKYRITGVALLVILFNCSTLAQTAYNDRPSADPRKPIDKVNGTQALEDPYSQTSDYIIDLPLELEVPYSMVSEYEMDLEVREVNDTNVTDFDSKVHEKNHDGSNVHDGDSNHRNFYDKATGNEEQMNIYPNPSDGQFQLELRLEDGDQATYRIIDMTGKIVATNTVSGIGEPLSIRVDISEFGAGYYFLQLEHGALVTTKKLVVF